VGDRYGSSGDDMANLIREGIPEDREWSDNDPITFDIPEYIAWRMLDLARGDGSGFPCFGPGLCKKMNDFMGQIV
jgi:hypothetical protein